MCIIKLQITLLLTKKQKNKLLTTEMRCLAAGVTRRNQIRNDVIRERLGIEPILKYIQKQQIKWFANLERMPCDSIPYKAYIKRGKEDEDPELDLEYAGLITSGNPARTSNHNS
jgi:hypothetical protein